MIAECTQSTDSVDGSELPASLITARLRLDRPELADAGDLLALANNRKIAEMTARMPHPYGVQDARSWIAGAANPVTGTATFAVRMRSTGRLIGACGYGPMEGAGEPQLGYWIGEPFWGQGLATEAAHAVIDHAFGKGGLNELVGSCRLTNPASRRVLEKSGFQYRDRGMIRSRALGGAVPVENYALDRKTWDAIRQWGVLAS